MKYSGRWKINILLMAIVLFACPWANAASPAVVYSFEGPQVSADWRTPEVDLSISDRHYKWEKHSLEWRWKSGDVITVRQPKGLAAAGNSSSGGIIIWIYNETPTRGSLVFQFGTRQQFAAHQPAPYQFQYHLDYKGWRAAWVRFKEDATNPAYRGKQPRTLDAMRIIAPRGADRHQGRLFLDAVQFPTNVYWMRTPDNQVPFINTRWAGIHSTYVGMHESNNVYFWAKIQPAPAPPAQITSEEKQAFQTITNRYDRWIVGDHIDINSEPYYKARYDSLQGEIKRAKRAYAKLDIQRKDGVITGTPLFSLMSGKHSRFSRSVFTACMVQLALDWRLNGDAKSKQDYFNLLDYIHDQGWEVGSGLGTLTMDNLWMTGYVHSVFIMRDALREAGRLKHELDIIRWFISYNRMYYHPRYREFLSDQLRTMTMFRVLVVLMMEDSPAKVRDMRCLDRWLNEAVAIAPGWADMFKPDGTAFHHRGIYVNAYTPQAIHNMALVYWMLHGTPFAMSATSGQNLCRALLTDRIITHKYQAPIAVCGRYPWGPGVTNRLAPAYAYMALSSDPINEEMAAAFMRLWKPNSEAFHRQIESCTPGITYFGTMGALQVMTKLAAQGIAAEPAPSGNWMFPYGGLMIHRRANWMVGVRGWSQYVWGYETDSHENIFGRYASYGAVQIMRKGDPVNYQDSGYVEEGWDWSRWPGTTVIDLPIKQLAGSREHSWGRAFTDQTFVGGVSLQGRDGLFAMRLHDTIYNPSFYADKSVFFFGDRIVCLGNDIRDNDAQHPTQTTLFQTYLPSASTPTWINDQTSVTKLPLERTFDDGQRVWLMDAVGNGYVIPQSRGLHVARQHQRSMDSHNKKETEGDFAVAWIDHGKAPHDGSYQYAILVNADSPQQVAKFAASPGYQVLRCDRSVHAVRDLRSGEIGYAVFEAKAPVDIAPLARVNKPCMVMLKQSADQIVMGVADPDLRLLPPGQPRPRTIDDISGKEIHHPSVPSVVRVMLTGPWKLAAEQAHVKVVGNASHTIVTVTCRDGMTVNVTLERVGQAASSAQGTTAAAGTPQE